MNCLEIIEHSLDIICEQYCKFTDQTRHELGEIGDSEIELWEEMNKKHCRKCPLYRINGEGAYHGDPL